MRILHLSDIHFGLEHRSAVAATPAFCHAAGADLLIMSGDITQYGRRKEFTAGRAFMDSLPGPQLMIPGNHDVPYSNLLERAAMPFARYRRLFGDPWRGSFEAPGVSVAAVNSSRGAQWRLNWSKGALNARQVREAADRLRAAPADALRILVTHHPLIEVEGTPMTGGVRGGVAAAEAFAGAGADLILTGHVHVPFALAVPGDGRTYAVGAGTLSVRERGAPPSFNLIERKGDTVTVTAVTWDGHGLVEGQTWPLQLRPRGGAAPESHAPAAAVEPAPAIPSRG